MKRFTRPARRPAGERAGQLRTYEEGVGQCLLVHGVGAGLGGGEERRAELGRARARGERGGDLAAAHDAAGRDDRDLHGLADLRDQREQPDAGTVGLRIVAVGALVAARLHALHDHRVGARPLRGLRLVGGGRRDQGAACRPGAASPGRRAWGSRSGRRRPGPGCRAGRRAWRRSRRRVRCRGRPARSRTRWPRRRAGGRRPRRPRGRRSSGCGMKRFTPKGRS